MFTERENAERSQMSRAQRIQNEAEDRYTENAGRTNPKTRSHRNAERIRRQRTQKMQNEAEVHSQKPTMLSKQQITISLSHSTLTGKPSLGISVLLFIFFCRSKTNVKPRKNY